MANNSSNMVKTWIKGNKSPYQLHDLTHFPDWDNLIVWDAFFNNLTSGLMVITAIAWLAGPPALGIILALPLTLALLLVLIDLLILVMDLGDPWRFYHCLRVMRFTSPLSVGVWGLVCYSAFLTLAVLFNWLLFFVGGPGAGFFIPMLARLFTVMALIGALVVICYKGVVFSCSSQPGLRQARWLTPFMVSDSLLMGLAVYVLIILLSAASYRALFIFPMVTLILAHCITWHLLGQDVKPRAKLVYGRENRVVSVIVHLLGGLGPLILCFCGFFGQMLAAFCVLACGVVVRYWIIGLAKPQ